MTVHVLLYFLVGIRIGREIENNVYIRVMTICTYWYGLIFYILVDYHGPCLLYYICKSLIISNKKRYVNTFYDFLGGVLSWSQQNGLQGVC